ncbi:MAG TPA: carboxypeptidase-like regulatory domain-containing protein, partial [Bacteroidia bacterium]|nr:carboxypeptidase-like regulatory domain-containing protein [Bacteroidia bacterium]
MKLSKFCFLVIVLLMTGSVLAQTGTIKGFVYVKESGEPVLFTTVFLKGTSIGQTTDVNGYFSISQIPPGDYTIMITGIGYDTLQEQLHVKAGAIISKKLYLIRSDIKLQEIEVSAEQAAKQNETQISVNKIDPVVIKKIPTVGGEPDLAQYLQVLPGVIFTGDQGGQLYIRGGS